MNWYIGQRIVAVKDQSQGVFKKGDDFTISGIKKAHCEPVLILDIGLDVGSSHCGNCYASNNGSWFAEDLFAPLETRPELSEITAEELIEEIETKKATI